MSEPTYDIITISDFQEIFLIISSFGDDLDYFSNKKFLSALQSRDVIFKALKRNSIVQAYCLLQYSNKIFQMFHYKSYLDSEDFFDALLYSSFDSGKIFNPSFFRSTVLFPISSVLKNSFISYGFAVYNRFFMVLQLSDCSFPYPDLEGFSIRNTISDFPTAIIDLIMIATRDQLDSKIYPEFLDFNSLQNIYGFKNSRSLFYSEKGSVLLFHNDKLIGVNLIKLEVNSCATVWQLAIHPSFRRQKLARKIMILSILALQEMGIKELTLNVSFGNPAQFLYETLGFKIKDPLFSIIVKPY